MLTSPSSTVSLFMTWGRRRRIHKCIVWLVSKFTDGIVMKNVDLMWYGLVLLCNDWIWNWWLGADFWKWTPGNNWGWRRAALSLWWKVFRPWGGWERERGPERWDGSASESEWGFQQTDPIPAGLSLLLCLNLKNEYHTIMSPKTPNANYWQR